MRHERVSKMLKKDNHLNKWSFISPCTGPFHALFFKYTPIVKFVLHASLVLETFAEKYCLYHSLYTPWVSENVAAKILQQIWLKEYVSENFEMLVLISRLVLRLNKQGGIPVIEYCKSHCSSLVGAVLYELPCTDTVGGFRPHYSFMRAMYWLVHYNPPKTSMHGR